MKAKLTSLSVITVAFIKEKFSLFTFFIFCLFLKGYDIWLNLNQKNLFPQGFPSDRNSSEYNGGFLSFTESLCLFL